MEYLKADGAELHYTTSGAEGDWVTLVNGHTRSIKDFRMMIKAMNSEGFRVLCGDNRGAGLTKSHRAFSLADLNGDLFHYYSALDITKSHLVGLSMGGMIALHSVLERPDFFPKLVLISTASSARFIRSDESEWPKELADIEARLASYFSTSFRDRNRPLVKAMAKQMQKDFAMGSAEQHQGATYQRQAMAGFEVTNRLAEIEIPVLIIHGEEDDIVPPAAAEELAQKIPGAQLHMFAGAGHLLLAERPKELYQVIAEFLR